MSQSRDLPRERCGLPVDVLFEHLLAGIFGGKQERRGPAGQIESALRFSFLEGGEVGNYVNLRRTTGVLTHSHVLVAGQGPGWPVAIDGS